MTDDISKPSDRNLISTRLLRRVQRVTGLGLGLLISLTVAFFSAAQYSDLQREARDQAGFAAESVKLQVFKDAADLKALGDYLHAVIRANPDGISSKDIPLATSIMNSFLRYRNGQVIAVALTLPKMDTIVLSARPTNQNSPEDRAAIDRLRHDMIGKQKASEGFTGAEVVTQGSAAHIYTFTKTYIFAQGGGKNKATASGYEKAGQANDLVLGIVSNAQSLQEGFVKLGLQVRRRGWDVEYRIRTEEGTDAPSSYPVPAILSYRTVENGQTLSSARRRMPDFTLDNKPVQVEASIVSNSFLIHQLSLYGLLLLASAAFFLVIRLALARGVDTEVAPLEQLGRDLQKVTDSNFRIPVFAGGSDEVRTIAEQIEAMRQAMLRYLTENQRLSQTAAIANTTQMLAHDVRKPFSMLKMGLGMLGRAQDPEGVKIFCLLRLARKP